MYTSRPLRQRGVTLIEMIFFIVIVSVALAGLVQVFNLAARDSADPVRRKQALMLAEAMMAEVQQASFTYCDPTDPEAATAASPDDCTIREAVGQGGSEPVLERPYNNVNDYVAKYGEPTEAFGPAGLLADVNTKELAGLPGYAVKLTITPTTVGGVGDGSDGSDALLITIVVEYDDGQSLRLDGYRLRYAPRFL